MYKFVLLLDTVRKDVEKYELSQLTITHRNVADAYIDLNRWSWNNFHTERKTGSITAVTMHSL